MAISLKAYADSSLVSELTQLSVTQLSDGTTGPVDVSFWVGSTASGKKFEAESDPGVDQIVLSIADSASGTGHPATEIKLALSAGGLASATAGASLNLGTSILSGALNAVRVYARVQDSTGAVGVSTELSLNTNSLLESDV